MNPNADYLGIVTLLRGLREQGLVSGSEAKKIAARLMVSPVPPPASARIFFA